jgi:hypothetical protein
MRRKITTLLAAATIVVASGMMSSCTTGKDLRKRQYQNRDAIRYKVGDMHADCPRFDKKGRKKKIL